MWSWSLSGWTETGRASDLEGSYSSTQGSWAAGDAFLDVQLPDLLSRFTGSAVGLVAERF